MNAPITTTTVNRDVAELPAVKKFCSHDGAQLAYRHWSAVRPGNSRKAVVLFHRGHEHGGRISHLVDELLMPECDFFAWDMRGLGVSEGTRGYAEDIGELIRDIDAFVRHITSEYQIATSDISLVGQSVGAVLVAAYVHDYAPDIRAMVLAAPAFKVNLFVPFARQGLALWQQLRGTFFVNSYVRPEMLTRDSERVASYKNDPLITRPIASNILLQLYETGERLVEDAAAIQVPTLVFVSGDDWVVDKDPQYRFAARLGGADSRLLELPGFRHDTLGEAERELAIAPLREFLQQQYAYRKAPKELRRADRNGYSAAKYHQLSQQPGRFAKLKWRGVKVAVRAAAKLSDGYKLGLNTGFDSGATLDYVYRNKASGKTFIGRWIDRLYLDNIGWQGIRQRKVHLEQLIQEAIDQLGHQQNSARIMDIAAGHGRYLLDAIEPVRNSIGHLQLRDFSEANVEACQQQLEQRGLTSVAEVLQADAFDYRLLVGLAKQPNLVVVSGLYELFSDNCLVERSLAGISDLIEEGGYLIYTNQPWHPQQELIARGLTSHRGNEPWVMRCRSQAEMDQLVTTAGFTKQAQLTDQWGIFSVSIARKVTVDAA